MYQRYGQPSRPSNATKTQQTILLLILLALTIVCIGLVIVYSSASKANNSMRKTLVSRIQIEVSNAQTSARQLSPTGGSKTESMVATVRQHVYAARTVNKMAEDIYGVGNVLVNELYINNCIDFLNKCDDNIQTGQVVTGTYSQLSEAIDILYEQVAALE